MKKPQMNGKALLILALIMIILVAAGCSNSDSNKSEKKPEVSQVPQNIMIGSGPAEGPLGLRGDLIAQVIRKQIPGSSVTPFPTGGLSENANLLRTGEIQMGLVVSTVAKLIAKGEPPFKESYSGLRGIAGMEESYLQLVVLADTGLKSFDDVKAKKFPLKIGTSAKGSGPALGLSALLESHGITEEELKQWGGEIINFPGITRAMEALNEGVINSIGGAYGTPVAQIEELARTKDIVILPINNESALQKLNEKGYFKATLTAGKYTFLKEDMPLTKMRSGLFVAEDFPDEWAYQIAKAIHNELEFLHTGDNALKVMTPESIVRDVDLGVPLHPGAVRYYKEAGLLK